jgi:iron-sulfur cluster repair protein YtfE (RIC family)
MSEQKTIREFYEKDHGRLDELFKTFQQLKRSHPPKAKGVFEEFKFGLERHIVWEEDLLFPLWEKKTGRSEEGPTVVMRGEHRQIKRQLEAIHGNVLQHNCDSDQEEQALLDVLGSQNRKEERALYPAIDQVASPEDREAVFRNMKLSPEG